MQTETREGTTVLRADDAGPVLSAPEDADALVGASYEGGAETIVVSLGRLDPEFFTLASGVAAAFTQRLTNYGKRLVVLGDVSAETAASSTVESFVRDSNAGDQLWFLPDEAALDARLRASDSAGAPADGDGGPAAPGPAR